MRPVRTQVLARLDHLPRDCTGVVRETQPLVFSVTAGGLVIELATDRFIRCTKQNSGPKARCCLENSGRGERIRTSGLYVPNVALYRAKLHPDG